MHNLPRTMSLGVAAGCAAALALPPAAPAAKASAPPPAPLAEGSQLVALRRQGPAALDALLARWDRMEPGPQRDRLTLAIDAVAAQRYATVSRLFWYTDLAAAQEAARTLDRPILALRMLGRLDEDLSCANSRFFRTTLYANTDVSRFLRDNFVLYWSSERAVPRVTIDFGDGRKLVRTTTGNSAHYVLDAAGNVLDVLPGLYAPAVFKAELAKSAQLAKRVRRLGAVQRTLALADHHRRELEATAERFTHLAGTQFLRGKGRLLGANEVDASALNRAQRATMSKMIVEMPDLGKIGITADGIAPDDVTTWATVGQKAWGIFGPATQERRAPRQPEPRMPALVLDAQSRALVAAVHNAGPVASPPAETAEMLARLEQHVLADTALNEFQLRQQIRGALAYQELRSFEELNAWIYANVFHTPKADAWLGLLPRTDFTGLPGDGVVMR
jgi:hypothetical protein